MLNSADLVAEKFSCSAKFCKKEFTIVSNLRFISRTNFMLSRVEQEKRFITSGPDRPKASSGELKCNMPCLHDTTVFTLIIQIDRPENNVDSYHMLQNAVSERSLHCWPVIRQSLYISTAPTEVGNILSWRLIMKYFLRSFSLFRWFKKGSCQLLAKESAQYWLTA